MFGLRENNIHGSDLFNSLNTFSHQEAHKMQGLATSHLSSCMK